MKEKIPTEEELQAESLVEILKAVSDNRQAIISFLDILKELQEAGLLDIVQGIMKNRSNLGSVGFEFIKVANVPIMLKKYHPCRAVFLGRLDPAKTQKLISGIGSGLEQSMHKGEEPANLWGLLGLLKDPNVTASISTTLHFLRGLGEELNKPEDKV